MNFPSYVRVGKLNLKQTIPETNSSHLKTGGWETILPFWVSVYFQELSMFFLKLKLQYPFQNSPVLVQQPPLKNWPSHKRVMVELFHPLLMSLVGRVGKGPPCGNIP